MDVLIDYLSFTSKVHSFVEILDIFKLYGIEFEEGSKGSWEHHLYFGGIHIHHGGRDDVGIEMSGTGCRTLETIWNNNYDWLGLFDYLSSYGADVNVSRLDLACDEKDGILPLQTMMRHAQDFKYISLARRRRWVNGDERSIYFGSPKSSRRLRIYDKALERSLSLKVDPSELGHWVRVEFQLRDEAADRAIALMIRERHIGKVFRGLLYEYLRFTTTVPDRKNRNYSRLSMPKWWETFLDGADRLEKLTTGGKVYNMEHITSFIVTQCAPSLKAFIEGCQGDIQPLLDIISEATLSRKQREAVRLHNIKCCEGCNNELNDELEPDQDGFYDYTGDIPEEFYRPMPLTGEQLRLNL